MSYPGQGAPRKSNKALPIIAAVIAGVLLIVGIRWFTTRDDPTTTGSGDTTTASAAQPPRDGCTAVTVAASSEKAALLNQLAADYNSSGRTVDGRCFDVTVNSVASGTAEANLAEGWDESLDGPAPDVWTPAASTWVSLLASDLTAKDRPNIVPATIIDVDHLDPAGAGHAGADGQGVGLAGCRDRLVGRAGAGPGPAGVGSQGPPGVGPLHPRQDQPHRVHVGPGGHHRHAGRRHRDVLGPDRGGVAAAGGAAVPQGRGNLGHPLRRHHADLFDQPAARRRLRRRPGLRVRGRGRGEERPGLQRRQPQRRPEDTRPARPAEGAARRRLSQGGHALQRQPVRHPGRAVVHRREAGRRPGLPGVPAAARAAEGVHRRQLPHRRRAAGRPDHVQPVPDRGRREDHPEPAGTAGPARRAGAVDRGPQARAGAGGDGRVRVDGQRSGSGGESKLDLAKKAATSALEPVDRHRPGGPVGVHHRPADSGHHHRRPGRRRPRSPRPGSRSSTRSPA